jgi:hypothetical protein
MLGGPVGAIKGQRQKEKPCTIRMSLSKVLRSAKPSHPRLLYTTLTLLFLLTAATYLMLFLHFSPAKNALMVSKFISLLFL